MSVQSDAANRLAKIVFAKGSKNFYTASLFFPRRVGRQVAILYSFVRTVDNFVDNIPQQIEQLERFEQNYRDGLSGNANTSEREQDSDNRLLLDAFLILQKECNFKQKWIDAFFRSMHLDVVKREYDNQEEICEYMHGSAEIVGLCMMRIVGADPTADEYACLFGRALQYINFIRDIDEDNTLGRRYLPLPDGMSDLGRESAGKAPAQFTAYIRHEIEQFRQWLREGVSGLVYIPRLYRIPIKTAGDVFMHIANKIYRNPLLIYQRKVGLSRIRIVSLMLLNAVSIALRVPRKKTSATTEGK